MISTKKTPIESQFDSWLAMQKEDLARILLDELLIIALLLYGCVNLLSLLKETALIIVRRSQQLQIDVQGIIGALQTAAHLKAEHRKEAALSVLSNMELKIKMWSYMGWFLNEEFVPNAVQQKFHDILGRAYVSCQDYALGVKHYEHLRRLIGASKASNDTKIIDKAVVGLLMADIYNATGRIQLAIEEVQASIVSFLQFDRFNLAKKGYKKLAAVHKDQNNWPEVTTCLKKVISMLQKLPNDLVSPSDFALVYKQLGTSLRLGGIIWFNAGEMERMQKLLNEAVTAYDQALKFFEMSDSKWNREVSSCYKYLAESYSALNNTKAAKIWYSKHVKLRSTLKDKEEKSEKTRNKRRKKHKRGN